MGWKNEAQPSFLNNFDIWRDTLSFEVFENAQKDSLENLM